MHKSYKDEDDEHQKLINSKSTSYNDDDDDDDKYKNPSSRLEWGEASWTRWWYLLWWQWIYPTLSTGYKQTLTEDDLDGLPHKDKSSVLLNRLQSYDWTANSSWKILVQEFWREYIWVGILCIPYLLSRVAQPLLLRQVVLCTMSEGTSLVTIYSFIILLCVCGMIQVFFDNELFFLSLRVGIRIRNALTSIIYTRSLSIKSTAWQYINTGQIINLIVGETSKFETMCSRLHLLMEGPVEIIVIFACLCVVIGPVPTLIGCSLFCLSLILVLLTTIHLEKYNEQKLTCSDKRVHAFNEFIHGCYIVKMYNWEKAMEDRINQLRQDELFSLKRTYILKNLNAIYSFILTPILALAIFGSAWFLDYPLQAVDCFTAVAFFGLIRIQVMFLMPLLTERLIDVRVTSKRIDAFMRLATTQNQQSSPVTPSDNLSQKGKIVMNNATFSWHDDHSCLSSINLNIEPGSFVGIIGAVGSGKSSLLAAVLGEMNLDDGECYTNNSSFSYAAQSSWIFADTIRNNILLNRPFDEKRYREVVHACCLDVDLNLFGVSGDLTVIGERGANLSGGQKARLSLARALYDEADIYLIDDPLAAVDGTVAKQIYERCFSSQGILKNKTRLLVTHQTQFLNETQQIVFLVDGRIDEHGHLDHYAALKDDPEKRKITRLDSMLDENASTPDTQSIIVEETSVSGKINWGIWFRLFTTPPLGIPGFILLIVLLVLAEVFFDGTNYWLSIWLRRSNADQQHIPILAYTYFGLTIGTIIADIVRTVYYFAVVLNGTNYLHNTMLKSLLHASVQFFESNPSGRIVSRASQDQKVIDELLPPVVLSAIKLSLMAVGSVAVICLIKPYILGVFLFSVPFIVLLCRFYLRSKHQLKRLESSNRSPVYELLASSLNGLTTIRAFKVKNDFIKKFTDRVDRNTCVYINLQGAERWFALRLNLLPFINTFATAILLVVFRNELDSALIALCLMYALSIPKSFQAAIKQLLEADFLVTSAERIHEYSQLPSEEDFGGEQRLINTAPKWPVNGKIQFENYSLRHRSGLEPILKDINVKIESGEKIGIIGRTGAGKSSLFKGIFRFIDRSNIDGVILIDDIDISRVTLDHLRSRLSIIPQHPTLFSGTLRYNLDPFHLYSDEECWTALEDIQLKQFVTNHPAGLLMPIAESGTNLSAGQSQLLCIARAILKKSKILLIDEATSNVDQKTDEIIQTAITNQFRDRTVLTIAHRLNTVAKSDRILVLDEGRIVNYDTPMNVLQFYQ